MPYPHTNHNGAQSTSPVIDVDGIYALGIERQIAYRKKARYCKKCGKKLSGYNHTKECFYHPTFDIPDAPKQIKKPSTPKAPHRPAAIVIHADLCLMPKGKAPNYYDHLLASAKKLGYASVSEAALAVYEQTGSLRKTARILGYVAPDAVRRHILAAGGSTKGRGRMPKRAVARRLAVGQ